MSEPRFDRNATEMQLTWGDPEHITIRADRVSSDKKGVYGELEITNTATPERSHLHGPVLFNFIASTTRKQLASTLSDMLAIDWLPIIEYACNKFAAAFRDGEPAYNMADVEMPESLGMRVAPLLQEKCPTIFFGEGDSLKSYFATYLAVITRLGYPAAGLMPEPGNVLFLDYEDERDSFWKRLNMITAGLGEAIPDGIIHRKMVMPLEKEISAITKFVRDLNIELLIIDSAAPASSMPEEADSVINYFNSLRSLNVTSLTIAHDTKATQGVGQYPFGSVFWRNMARSLFFVKADHDDDSVAISLRHTKANNGKRLPLLAWEWHFDQDAVHVSTATPSDYVELSKGLGLRERLSEILNQPQSVRDIAEELGADQGSIRKTLNRGEKKGTFQRQGDLWAKTYPGQE